MNLPGDEEGGEAVRSFTPPPEGWGGRESDVEREDGPGLEEEADPEGPDGERGLGLAFFGTDPKSWESGALVPGAIMEFEISDKDATGGTGRNGLVAIFIRDVEVGDHGAWIRPKMLGGSVSWSIDWGVKAFSREKQRIHVCRHGLKHCKIAEARGHHLWEFYLYPPGIPPPAYVVKARVREWKKEYKEIMEKQGKLRRSPKEGAGDAPLDRVAQLRARLMQARDGPLRPARELPELPPPDIEGDKRPELPAVKDQGRPKGRDRSPSAKGPEGGDPKKGVRSALIAAAAKAEAARGSGRSRQRRKKRSRSRGRRRRSKGRRRRSSSRSRTSSSSSSSLVPPLQKKAHRRPGSVLKMLTSNVSEALAQAAVTDPEQPAALGSSANQAAAGEQGARLQRVGNSREVHRSPTRGAPSRARRRPSREVSSRGERWIDEHWADAQHLEVIPTRHHGLASPSVLLQAQRHTRQVEKAAGRKTWPRPGGGNTGGWTGKGEGRPDPGGKGDGRPRGKGPRKGGGKGKGNWKDKEKPEGGGDPGAK